MIVSPAFPGRVWSGPLVLLLIALISFYTDVFSKFGERLRTMICPFLYCIFFMITICVYGKGLYYTIKVNTQYRARMEMIGNAIEKGNVRSISHRLGVTQNIVALNLAEIWIGMLMSGQILL